jgi:hypothetical protein
MMNEREKTYLGRGSKLRGGSSALQNLAILNRVTAVLANHLRGLWSVIVMHGGDGGWM